MAIRAVRSVEFNAGPSVESVSVNAAKAPPVAIDPGLVAAAAAPAPAPAVNGDGMRLRQFVEVKLRNEKGEIEIFELRMAKVHEDGSLGDLNAQYTYAELKELAARIQALNIQGQLFGQNVSEIRSLSIDLDRGDRRHAFTLQKMSYTLKSGGAPTVKDASDPLYNAFIAGRQQALAELGRDLARIDGERRERQETLRREGPSGN